MRFALNEVVASFICERAPLRTRTPHPDPRALFRAAKGKPNGATRLDEMSCAFRAPSNTAILTNEKFEQAQRSIGSHAVHSFWTGCSDETGSGFPGYHIAVGEKLM